jgi:hypothetical protein
MVLSLLNISAERLRIFLFVFFTALTFTAVLARVGVVATVPKTSDWHRYPVAYGAS